MNSSLTLKELLDLHEKSKVLFDYVEDGEVLANMVKDEKEEKTKVFNWLKRGVNLYYLSKFSFHSKKNQSIGV